MPLLSIDSEQSSGVFTSTNPDAGIYVEHLDSTRDKDDIDQITLFLDSLSLSTIHRKAIILYISPSIILDCFDTVGYLRSCALIVH